MISQVTKKWKKKIEKLEEALDKAQSINNQIHDETVGLRAKLERYEARESGDRQNMVSDRRELSSQVEWLRDLVEHLVIPPDAIKARTTKEIRIDEIRNRRMKEQQKEMRAERNFALHRDKTLKDRSGKELSELKPMHINCRCAICKAV